MATNHESITFSSVIPLVGGGFFAPPYWDDVLNFNWVDVSLLADTNCKITVMQSPDKVNITSSTVLNTTANTPYTQAISIYSRFVQLRVDNLGITQTKFSFQTIFKQISAAVASIGNQNVNVFTSNGGQITTDSGNSLNTRVNNQVNTTLSSIDPSLTNPDGLRVSSIIDGDNIGLAREATLEILNGKIPQLTLNNTDLDVCINSQTVGLALDSSSQSILTGVNSINAQIQTLSFSGNDLNVNIDTQNAGLALDSSSQSILTTANSINNQIQALSFSGNDLNVNLNNTSGTVVQTFITNSPANPLICNIFDEVGNRVNIYNSSLCVVQPGTYGQFVFSGDFSTSSNAIQPALFGSTVCIYGNISVSASGTLQVFVSNDGSTWVNASVNNISLPPSGDFYIQFWCSAPYLKVQSTAADNGNCYWSLRS